METKIIRNDTGLDFKRIEQLIKLFQDRASKKANIVRRDKSAEIKQHEKEAFAHFDLSDDLVTITEIDKKIEDLKNDRRVAEERIRDFTQGVDKDKRYNTFDTIREGSPIYVYAHKDEAERTEEEKRLSGLSEGIIEELWLAKDICQAADIYERYVAALEKQDS